MHRLSWFLFLLVLVVPLHGQERITSFLSEITVDTDATMLVKETIAVESRGQTIIHGIVREFPTQYTDRLGTNYLVDFSVQAVTHNGTAAKFRSESVRNGKKIYIGDADRTVERGNHMYTITYRTNRQLGFFKDHDELYWNVTGNGWRLPIEKAQAVVQLPTEIPASSLKAEAYTGLQGRREKNYTQEIQGNKIIFATTRTLQPGEGLTMVVTWPKGFIQQPTWLQNVYWFFRDNILILWAVFVWLLLVFLLMYVAHVQKRRNKPGTVIPLFYPPAGLAPSAVGFMKEMDFNDRFLAADIVDLAVRGFLTISYEPGRLYGGTYTLTATQELPALLQQKNLDAHDAQLLSVLFAAQKNSFVVSKQNAPTINSALSITREYCQSRVGGYVEKLSDLVAVAWLLCIVAAGPLLFLMPEEASALKLFAIAILVATAMLISRFYRVYTPAGRKLQDEIDGFEMYLTTAETERMKIIGTPPTRTPELYEKYLPYAMALGVEEQWTQQFAPLFEKMAHEGRAYIPYWYTGRSFRAESFGSELRSSFQSAISSASAPPGSSSGSGGRGSSGGGGGGGGGGGW